ncbi:hypothetical protein BT96DRAFT_1007802 [Gymnopus androsaceus JB14]|uniref:Uncharacterized protein n=1 Tax=Gymnopus androsaceus JB14 TaxID=1447944 RepID=A0A6A4GGR3_9AGAR|nr:hypothetical protein BT96DRAFT_1007802 [Gymnopus androsaceus JB14]
MSSVSQTGGLSDEEDNTTEAPIQPSPSDPISTRIRATATAKAISTNPFIAPAEPPLNQQTNTQKTDHFAQVPKLAPKGTNFLAFKERWHIAIAAAGFHHLFDPNFIPPVNPPDPLDHQQKWSGPWVIKGFPLGA